MSKIKTKKSWAEMKTNIFCHCFVDLSETCKIAMSYILSLRRGTIEILCGLLVLIVRMIRNRMSFESYASKILRRRSEFIFSASAASFSSSNSLLGSLLGQLAIAFLLHVQFELLNCVTYKKEPEKTDVEEKEI